MRPQQERFGKSGHNCDTQMDHQTALTARVDNETQLSARQHKATFLSQQEKKIAAHVHVTQLDLWSPHVNPTTIAGSEYD